MHYNLYDPINGQFVSESKRAISFCKNIYDYKQKHKRIFGGDQWSSITNSYDYELIVIIN